jgi:mono/diheme cytochrome c family protein
MKARLAIATLTVVLAAVSTSAWAQEGAAIYKSKCVVCHGDQGQGKEKLGPKLAGTAKSEANIVAILTKGGAAKAPHIKPMSSITQEQATAVAGFVKTLK